MNVLITGVSRGLGYYMSCQFLAEGHNVIGISRSSLDDTVPLNTLKANVNFTYYQVDITNQQEVTKTLSHIYSSGITLDIVILNAGGITNDTQNGFDYVNFSKIIELNFLSAMRIISIVLPKFLERENGVFVAISSISAIRAFSSSKASIGYPASKSALSMAFEGLRLHYLNHNIQFITVQPGFLAEKKVFLGTAYSKAATIIYKHIVSKRKSEVISFPLSIVVLSHVSRLFSDKFFGMVLAKLLKLMKKNLRG
ncbi:MAG TPA: SDR family NAD(P)-dependent oxidoreductase [Thiotrichaceae bacterium]|nr:SDR family NAD(P)-dependent oxidoreductase [Thiotrichaceae bacterium]